MKRLLLKNTWTECSKTKILKVLKAANHNRDLLSNKSSKDEILDFRNKKNVKISHITKLFASKKHLYVLTVANRGAKTEDFERFLSSVRLNSARTNQNDSAKTVNISSLTPITISQIGSVEEQSKDNTLKTRVPNPIKEVENPILFLTKPRVSYTESARKANVKGVIRLRLTFSKDGRISKLAVVSDLPDGLLRNAVFSALRIRFIPQEKDNELVDTTNVVEYSFDIY